MFALLREVTLAPFDMLVSDVKPRTGAAHSSAAKVSSSDGSALMAAESGCNGKQTMTVEIAGSRRSVRAHFVASEEAQLKLTH